MANLVPRRGSGFPDLLHWFESEWPFSERRPLRVESYSEDDEFVVRCELPGVDPDNDIHINVEGNQLRIAAERRREERSERHSEFRYGSFSRTMLLPSNCDTDNIRAEYEAGILTVRMPQQQIESSKEIPVARTGK